MYTRLGKAALLKIGCSAMFQLALPGEPGWRPVREATWWNQENANPRLVPLFTALKCH